MDPCLLPLSSCTLFPQPVFFGARLTCLLYSWLSGICEYCPTFLNQASFGNTPARQEKAPLLLHTDASVQHSHQQSESRDVGMWRAHTDDVSRAHSAFYVDDIPSSCSMSDVHGDDDTPIHPASMYIFEIIPILMSTLTCVYALLQPSWYFPL
jgi:hypothetical protein